MGDFILSDSTLAPPVAPLASQSDLLFKKCSQSVLKVTQRLQK
jgi:hypothetical protein